MDPKEIKWQCLLLGFKDFYGGCEWGYTIFPIPKPSGHIRQYLVRQLAIYHCTSSCSYQLQVQFGHPGNQCRLFYPFPFFARFSAKQSWDKKLVSKMFFFCFRRLRSARKIFLLLCEKTSKRMKNYFKIQTF